MIHTAKMVEALLLAHGVCTENCGIRLSSFMEENAQVSSLLNSKLIIGTQGAEMLTGDYDYFLLKGRKVSFIHGAKL